MGNDFLILFLENQLRDMQLVLHYAEQNEGQATVGVTSPLFDNPRLSASFTIDQGRQ